MSTLFLIKLSENDKRIIIALLFAIIILFVLIGLLGSLVVRIMKWQGKKCDALINEVVVNRIVTTPRQLKSYARKKNSRYFIKQAWVPVILISIGAILLVIHNAVFKNWKYNPFNTNDGFGTLLFAWDFGHIFTKPETGTGILVNWPKLINEPHFESKALFSYFIVPCFVVGGLWYFFFAQGYLARTMRAHKLAKTVFDKSLDNYNQNTPIQEVNTSENPQ